MALGTSTHWVVRVGAAKVGAIEVIKRRVLHETQTRGYTGIVELK